MSADDQTPPEEAKPAPTEAPSVTDAPLTESPAPESPSTAAHQNRSSNGIGWLALLLSLAALGLSGWLWQQSQQAGNWQGQLKQQIDQKTQTLNARLNNQTQQLKALSTELAALKQTQANVATLAQTQQLLQKQLDTLSTSQNAMVKRLEEQLRPMAKEWRLNEIEFLLRLAVDHIEIAQTPRKAIQSLEAAQQQILALDIPSYQPVLEAVVLSLNQLQTVPTVRLGDLQAQLLSLQEQIASEPRLPSPPDAFNKAPTGTWLDTVKHHWNRAVFFQLEEHAAIRPLKPEAQEATNAQLLLLLEQAQTALLLRDSQWYQSSLQRAMHWLETYPGTHPKTLHAKLETLKAETIKPALPDISAALTLFLEIRQRQNDLVQAWAQGGALSQ